MGNSSTNNVNEKRDLDIDTHRRYTDEIDKLGDGAIIAGQPHEYEQFF